MAAPFCFGRKFVNLIMTIQVYTNTEQDEKVLLEFLESHHYNYKSGDDDLMNDQGFLDEYNREIEESEAQIDAGEFYTHEEVKQFLADKKKRRNGGHVV